MRRRNRKIPERHVPLALLALFLSCSGNPSGDALWLWSGALQPTSFEVVAKVRGDAGAKVRGDAGAKVRGDAGEHDHGVRLLVSAGDGFEDARAIAPEPGDAGSPLRRFRVAALEPGTPYRYVLEVGGRRLRELAGAVRTPARGPQTFTVALGACARTGSNHRVFDEIRAHRPLFFLHLGDFHYENIGADRPQRFARAFDRVLRSPRQSALYRSVPIAYVWDDHDYGPNNSDGASRSRRAARLAYRQTVPHYPLTAGAGDAPIYQSFTIGRVLFVLTDGRSERSPSGAPDDARKTALGAAQKAWLREQLAFGARQRALVVWANSFPWIAPRGQNEDHWGGYATERAEIARFIEELGLRNLVMVSGDAHMVAADDGSNNRYGPSARPLFPVFHAAALDRRGSVKGGPYSEGAFPGGGQYGLLRIEDDGGDTVRVAFTGRRHPNRTLVSLALELPVPEGARPESARTDAQRRHQRPEHHRKE